MLFCSPLVMSKWELLSIVQKWEGGMSLGKRTTRQSGSPYEINYLCREREGARVQAVRLEVF